MSATGLWIAMAVMVVGAIAGIIVLAVIVPPAAREGIRDVAIILLAIESIALGLGVAVVVFVMWRLMLALQVQVDRLSVIAGDILTTVKETAQTTAETAKTAQGTATFISDRSARPLIDVYSIVNGASRFARAFFRSRETGSEEDRA